MITQSEPILSAEDKSAWETWMEAARVHATTQAHRRRVESSRRLLDKALADAGAVGVSWSGGKDSTVMTHLVCVMHGAKVTVVSEKDDLDFPGEREYVERLGREWSLDLRVIEPEISPRQWIEAHLSDIHVGDDIHGRSAGLSKAVFYRTMETEDRRYDAVMLGLRTEESGIRRELVARRGRWYTLASGKQRILPIAGWRGIDVYAYAETHGIELLPLYRCIGLMHAEEPWRLRKSWWLPGAGSARGQIAWLQRYYPSLYRQLVEWMPRSRMFT